MREILFRGRNVETGEWMYGMLDSEDYDADFTAIIPHRNERNKFVAWEVDPSTVGQYTGLTDKNGKRIFEGDIVTATDEIICSPFCYGITGKIVYDETSFIIEPRDFMKSQYLFNECAVYEVIGNIHDNPELLEEV